MLTDFQKRIVDHITIETLSVALGSHDDPRDKERRRGAGYYAYAPELNPVEFVWSYLKYGRICNLGAKDVHALSGILETELDRLQDNQPLLKKLWRRSGLPWPDRLLAS